jgi:hypothetical protein
VTIWLGNRRLLFTEQRVDLAPGVGDESNSGRPIDRVDEHSDPAAPQIRYAFFDVTNLQAYVLLTRQLQHVGDILGKLTLVFQRPPMSSMTGNLAPLAESQTKS